MKTTPVVPSGTAFQKTILALAIASVLGCTQEAPKLTAERQKICAAMDEAIDNSIRQYALAEIEGEDRDKSAVQQGARLTQMSNHLTAIQINLHLQERNKCIPRETAIDPALWTKPAKKCRSAIWSRSSKEVDTVEKDCDVKIWLNAAVK